MIDINSDAKICCMKFVILGKQKTTSKVFSAWKPGNVIILTFDVTELMIPSWGVLNPVTAINYTIDPDLKTKIGRKRISEFYRIFTLKQLSDEEFLNITR